MSEKSYDVAVIGGGPAGTSTAINLAKSGARIGLFEAKSYPHDKLCGEFLSPECQQLLRNLGVDKRLLKFGPARIKVVRITSPAGNGWEMALPGEAWGLSRKVLDAALARHAEWLGVEIREATRVTRVSGNLGEGFELETRTDNGRDHFRARVVVAAHGKRSNLDRSLERDFIHDHHPYVAIKSNFLGPSLSNRVELHAFPGGYCGLSAIEGNQQVVCALVRQSVFQQAVRGGNGHPIDDFLKWLQMQNGHLQRWFAKAERTKAGWISIAQVPFVIKPMVLNEVLMVGDAAGMIAPLAGDGIAMALKGGSLVGKYVLDFLNGSLSTDQLINDYQRSWQKRFAARLRLSYRLQEIMLRPNLANFTLRVIRAIPALGHYLVAKTRGVEFVAS